MAEEIELEKCNFWNFRSPVTLTLTLTLERVIRHTVVRQSSTSIYTLNFTESRKKTCGGRTDVRTDVPTDGWTFAPVMLCQNVNIKDKRQLEHRRPCQPTDWTMAQKQSSALWLLTNHKRLSEFSDNKQITTVQSPATTLSWWTYWTVNDFNG